MFDQSIDPSISPMQQAVPSTSRKYSGLSDYLIVRHQISASDVQFLNLTIVRPLFMLSHRGSDNSPLLIMSKELFMNFVFAYIAS